MSHEVATIRMDIPGVPGLCIDHDNSAPKPYHGFTVWEMTKAREQLKFIKKILRTFQNMFLIETDFGR